MAKSDILVRWKADTQNYDSNIAKARRTLDGFVSDNLSAGGAVKQLSSTLVRSVGSFASVTAVAGALSSALRNNIETARGFEKSMSQLSSLTGMTGESLNRLKEYSIELGSTTTLSASQVADAFRMIGSQQPQLLASGEALKQVTKYAITLSEAAGIDLVTASQTLSTSINQMGGDSSNAARYVNVLAAASQKGAGDIAWLGEALTKSATAAKAVGTDYEELVANLEQLAKAGFDASTAGTALRSIIMNLEKQANGEYKPSVVGLTKAFENLGAAHLTITEYQGLVGKMFATQAMALANAAAEARKMTKEITGTNTAEDQAKTNTENLDGALKSLSSAWEGLNLHINGTNSMLTPFVRDLTSVILTIDQLSFSTDNFATKLTKLGGLITKFGPSPLFRLLGIGVMTGSAPFTGRSGNGSNSSMSYNPKAGTALHQALFMGSSQYGQAIPTKTPSLADEAKDTVKSIKQLQSELKTLKTLRDEAAEAGDYDLRDQYNEEIKSVQAQIKVMRGGGSGGGGKNVKFFTGGISGLSSIDAMPIRTTESMAELNARLTRFQKALGEATNAADHRAAEQGIAHTKAQMGVQEIAVRMGLDTDSMLKLKDDIDKQMQTAIGDKIVPIKIETEPHAAAELEEDGKNVTEAWQGATSVIRSVGSALSSIENPAGKVVSIIAEAIANIAGGYAAAIGKEGAKSKNIYAFIASAAAAIVEMGVAISAVKQQTKFAEGGVVKGSTYSNDQIPALLNAGEVVLNRAQVGHLASALSEDNAGTSSQPYVSGEQIYLGLNNYLRRTGRGEMITSR